MGFLYLLFFSFMAWGGALEGRAIAEGYGLFTDPSSGRLLLEKKGSPPILLLLGSRYGLKGEVFFLLPEAPKWQGAQVSLGEKSFEKIFASKVPPLEQTKKAENLGLCGPGRTVKKVFLDPGHGGEDSGTVVGNFKEKDIVLQFAKLAAKEMKSRGFELSFSRTKDVFLPLEVRTKIAEQWKADIFISLHVNSSTHSGAHGTETYILSQEATDAEARKLALLENSIADRAKASQSAVQDILWDMEQTTYLQDSAYLASNLQGALVENAHRLLAQKKLPGDWKNRGVRQAPFYVLSRAPMPAVLVELGYLTHTRDRELLSQNFFLESLAKALAEGVEKYREGCRIQR